MHTLPIYLHFPTAHFAPVLNADTSTEREGIDNPFLSEHRANQSKKKERRRKQARTGRRNSTQNEKKAKRRESDTWREGSSTDHRS